MHNESILMILIFLGSSVVITYFLTKLKIHPIIGFIITGAFIGPNGFKIVSDSTTVETISEIGVILLLFTLGLEFSIEKLMRLKKYVFVGGLYQVTGTFILFCLLGYFFFNSLKVSVILGILTALSSTAIVLKLISEKGLVDSPLGKMGIGILLFQDIMVVPIMIIVPLFASKEIVFVDILLKVFKSFFIGGVVFFVSKYATNFILSKVVKLRVREIFILSIIVISLGMAYLTGSLGISMSMGAFLAGVVLADSIYTHQIIADIQPFKDSFLAVFFISIGLLTDPLFIIKNFQSILIFVASLIIIKGLIIFFVSNGILKSPKVSFRLAISLFQVGEFSFVVAALSYSLKIIDEHFYQLFLAGSVFSMILTPFGFKYGYKLYDIIFRKTKDVNIKEYDTDDLKDHVVIIGYGLNGRNLSHVLKETDIRYIICEMNINTVREMAKKGEPIIFGDATKEEILHVLGVEKARVVVIAISDPEATKRIVKLTKNIREDICVLVRTRYVAEVEMFRRLGADEIIPEEFETSIEIFSRVLMRYNVPVNIIHLLVNKIRENNYESLRTIDIQPKKIYSKGSEDILINVVTYKILPESELVSKSLKDIDLRKNTGASVIAIKRGETVIQSPTAEEKLQSGDIIYITGTKEVVDGAVEFLNRINIEYINGSAT
ncbi:cation:proton antiporter [Calditerrivibrio nitroreducens]|uniref:Sodium/hydrogen exchanger n=1 Tax=Calditerrivibrio nitroreducens (strain DSM 19672 / NBRC 101217 / Yu37-1) TaxID=768670 RepID=E4TEW4_CALNY|nr:cation:proton antiporter [Calditerrivibrio nitroreducens]ADR18370.1 sodium/hydrogen exchanger [Calditerrivibrio nitroreducens DSM 19672]